MIHQYVQNAVGIAVIIILLVPLILIAYGSIRLYKKRPDKASVFLGIGATILAALSSDYAATLILAFQGIEISPEFLTIKIYLLKGLNYLSLIFIAVGMLFFSSTKNV